MADSTSPTAVSSNRGVMIVLSYLWILALVPLLTEKEDQEVRWHAKNGIVLMWLSSRSGSFSGSSRIC